MQSRIRIINYKYSNATLTCRLQTQKTERPKSLECPSSNKETSPKITVFMKKSKNKSFSMVDFDTKKTAHDGRY